MAEEKLRWHKYQYLKAHKAFYCPNIHIFILTIIISIFGVHNCNNCSSLNPQVNHLLIAVLLSMRLRKNNLEKHHKLINHLYKKPWYKGETTGKNNFCKKVPPSSIWKSPSQFFDPFILPSHDISLLNNYSLSIAFLLLILLQEHSRP